MTVPSSSIEQGQAEGPLLECRGVSIEFGGVKALTDVSVQLRRGQIVSIIGPNGAGKSTLFNCISGLIPPDSGEVIFNGGRIDGWPMHKVARAGLVRTFQNIRMFPELTVGEILIVAQGGSARSSILSTVLRLPSYRREWVDLKERACEAAELLGLTEFIEMRASELPLLQQRKVEIARCIVARPEVIMLDEPFAGSTAREADELMNVVRGLKDRGISILLVEHTMRVVMQLSEYIYVINFGKMVAAGDPGEVSDNVEVQSVYLATAKPKETG